MIYECTVCTVCSVRRCQQDLRIYVNKYVRMYLMQFIYEFVSMYVCMIGGALWWRYKTERFGMVSNSFIT